MSYVVYNKETTRYLTHHVGVKTDKEHFATQAAAKAALTREAKGGWVDPSLFAVAESGNFHDNIEKMRKVKNLLTGKEVEIRENTPRACDPSSNLYHSM